MFKAVKHEPNSFTTMTINQAIKNEIKKQANRGCDIAQIEQAIKVQFPSTTWNARLRGFAQWTIIDAMQSRSFAYCNYGRKNN